ncbi:MAG: hypothetical protein KAT12_08915, partial [Gammaproteobacteria bacterium]|nr:hypothetical protein [Gammaproteobacteria bacterium]
MIAANVRHLRKKVSQKDTLLWFSMFSMLALFILVSYALNIPEDINLGGKAQTADTKLDEVRFHLLAVKKVTLQYHVDGNSINARSKFEKLKKQADDQIDHLEEKAAYSRDLSERIKVFRAAYNGAFDAERRYLNQISNTNQSSIAYGSDGERVIVSAQNHARFLDMVKILADTEIILHEAIARGREAFKLFQLAGALLLISFFTSIVLYQRNSSKEHTAREKNLEMTLRSIGDAV